MSQNLHVTYLRYVAENEQASSKGGGLGVLAGLAGHWGQSIRNGRDTDKTGVCYPEAGMSAGDGEGG